MKKIDWYIFKRYLITFTAMLFMFIPIGIIIDVSEKINRMIENKVAIKDVLVYYYGFTIYFANLLFPIFLFLSIIWFTSKLANNSEIIAILSSGISFTRFLRPYIVGATLVSLVTLLMCFFILPDASEKYWGFRYDYLRKNVEIRQTTDIFRQVKPNEYMLDFAIRSQGLEKVVNTSKPLDLEWQLKSYRNEKSISYENRYTELVFEYEDGKDDYLNAAKDSEDDANDVSYIAFKQHLFTSILLTDTKFKTAKFKSDNLVDDEEIDTVFTKNFTAQVPLEFKNGALNYNMNWYYGPSDYTILNDYNKNLDEIMPLGWGIFGWINRYIFIPVFGFISALGVGYGIAIVLFTILVRIVMSPVTYKSYLSQAKMKVLRPEIAELNEKFKDNPMKKQQETMKLYSKAGVNPMAGCLPALMQMPIFYALFQFFPSMFDLRQKSFLWADDLSSYDSIYQLPFHIPFYGSHVSLFPILASIAIFFYMKMTTGDQAMSTPPQEGMPDMGKIMKIMIYISPVMMLFFFNNYASGLSLYYFISNLITIGIMLVIKNYIVKEDKIHAQIQENKTKEKKESKFQKKMREMMEQAEAQKAAQKKK